MKNPLQIYKLGALDFQLLFTGQQKNAAYKPQILRNELIMKKFIPILFMFFIIFFSCSDKESPLANLDIQIGMERTKAENIIAQALKTKNKYSAYGNNLRGGIVKYNDGRFILEIKYKAGAPGVLFVNDQGNTQGFPPVDETVESTKFYKNKS
ncbi:MAG: hypothetical protein FP814_11005 [Desulfobacterium sp.]|nr:hypothetical protein [Desulfobacterium sp.]MBU3946819.1 hypothetical protein [Pseudomonadota bacterium]MBU4037302.1 hypothetical protein [Pseudomonadota bacterium]